MIYQDLNVDELHRHVPFVTGPSVHGHPSGPHRSVHSIKKDKSIKDNIESGLMVNVLERYFGGDESKIP